MKRAAAALRSWLADVIGIEGTFLALGIACLATGSWYVNPIGPWFVVGGASVLVGLLLVKRAAD